MIHISCHGNFYIKNFKKTFYLAFENVGPHICLLDKLDEDRLKDLLGDYKTNGLQIVFVSACQSEMIGQQFKRLGVPIVIAVN